MFLFVINNFHLSPSQINYISVDWDHSKILTFETDFTKRRFLESFFIHNSENSINDKENCFYSEIYDNLS